MAIEHEQPTAQQGRRSKNSRALWVSTSLATRGGIASYIRNMRETSLWRDWNIHHVATHCNGSAPTRIIRFGRGLVQFLEELLFNRPDIVHLHTSSYGSFARKCVLAWIAKAFNIPIVMHVHGSCFNKFFDTAPRPVQLLIRTTFEHVDAVIALGTAWESELRRIAPRAMVHVEANAIKPGNPVRQSTAGPVRVVFLGEVGERKGTFVLLAAWAELLRTCDPDLLALTVAGDGEVDRARRVVAELNIASTVDIRGWISATEVSALLDDAQVLVLPSLSEGQPIAVLEGMSRGMCIIATDVGGIPEMLGDGAGILVRPGNVDSLASAIKHVVGDSDSRIQLGSVAHRLVREQFDIDMASRRFDKLYRLIIAGRSAT